MTIRPTIKILTVILVAAATVLTGCRDSGEKASGQPRASSSELIIFHAGSLAVPFREISALFEAEHPGVTVRAEAAGSRDSARKISDLGRECDIFGSADYKVVTNLLMPDHVSFNILFAANEMVIAYTDTSAMREKITPVNWPEVLMSDGVLFGRSDPNRDPCGYRAVMVFQLAERHYGIPGLAGRLIDKSSGKCVRPKETELLALLEAGEIDYLIIYRSVAAQHGLDVLGLSDEINLSSPSLASHYETATVQVTGSKPGEFIERKGEPIVYSVTIPNNAPNRKMAELWVQLLLSARGREVMVKSGQSCLTPPEVDTFDALPQSLRQFCK